MKNVTKGAIMRDELAIIIEDNEELCGIYAIALKSLYPEIENILDGHQAMERLEEVVPGLIIIDVNLPLVSGHAVYKRIRSDLRFDKTLIIVATANILADDTLKSEINHLDRIIVKPVSPKLLRQVVENLRASQDT
jgi:DNA-binding response OmpR family regulator